jgi:hypothetical protein
VEPKFATIGGANSLDETQIIDNSR